MKNKKLGQKVEKFIIEFDYKIAGKKYTDQAVFDTKQKAKKWIKKTGRPNLEIKKVLGKIAEGQQKQGPLDEKVKTWKQCEREENADPSPSSSSFSELTYLTLQNS